MTNYPAIYFDGSERSRHGISEVPQNRARPGCLVRQIDFNFVDIAPASTFWRIISLDDRMPHCFEVRLRMPVRRLSATADMVAAPPESQMHPRASDLQALFAAERAWADIV
jgi:hypothetical protein